MKTLLAALIALGTLAGTANAQHVRFIGHGYSSGPEICEPGTLFQRHVTIAPQTFAPVQQAEAPAEAAPEAAPEAPADNAPLEAPLPPK